VGHDDGTNEKGRYGCDKDRAVCLNTAEFILNGAKHDARVPQHDTPAAALARYRSISFFRPDHYMFVLKLYAQ
jgi:hypothetical protein